MTAVLRPATASDVDALAALFLRVRAASVPAIPPVVHPAASVAPFLAGAVARDDVTVAEVDGVVVGFLARSGSEVDHLYVDGAHASRGVGSALLGHARAASPHGLALWTFEANVGARRFYARHGFVETGRTDGDNEEGAPDVRMEWRPAS